MSAGLKKNGNGNGKCPVMHGGVTKQENQTLHDNGPIVLILIFYTNTTQKLILYRNLTTKKR